MKKKRKIEKSALFLAVCHNGADFSCLIKDLYMILKKVLDTTCLAQRVSRNIRGMLVLMLKLK